MLVRNVEVTHKMSFLINFYIKLLIFSMKTESLVTLVEVLFKSKSSEWSILQ